MEKSSPAPVETRARLGHDFIRFGEKHMSNGDLGRITNFIWFLPMTVLRRLDTMLEPAKKAVPAMKESLDKVGVTKQRVAA